MPGPRQTTDVILANGRKHLSKAEGARRRAGEVKVEPARTARPPKWLPEGLKKGFRALGKKLIAAGLYTELDADNLGRYLVAQAEWVMASGEAQKALAQKNLEMVEAWGRVQDRYFKQARACANDLGMTITSRCRLVVPEGAQKQEENPFLQLMEARRRA